MPTGHADFGLTGPWKLPFQAENADEVVEAIHGEILSKFYGIAHPQKKALGLRMRPIKFCKHVFNIQYYLIIQF